MKIKLKLPKLTPIFNAELQAIQEAVELMRKNKVGKKIICTDSLSNQIAQQNLVTKRNPKANNELKDLMVEESINLKLMWVTAHTGIKGSEDANQVATESLEQKMETSNKVGKTEKSLVEMGVK
jgi:ribonuclease HI